MAVDKTTLRARFPEFTNTPDSLVDASIADAKLMVDSVYYGTRYDMAVTYYAAHLIAVNPLGEMARLDKKADTTTYWLLFESVKRATGTGFRVI